MATARKIRAKKLIRPGGVTIKAGEIALVDEALVEKYIAEDKVDLLSLRTFEIPDEAEILEETQWPEL